MSDSPFWIFLFGALSVYPFFPLRHMPVMKRLKIPFRRLLFYATLIMLVQGFSYLWLSQTFSLGLAELAWHRKLFMIPYILLTLYFSKDTPTKTLFMDFFMVGIVMATIDGSFILCKTLFADSYMTSPRMTDTLVRLALIAVIYPPLYLFFTKVLTPIMAIKAGDVWRYITAIPAVFAVISIVTTMEAFGHEISTVFIFLRLFIIIGSVLVCSLMAQVVRRMEQAAIAEEQVKQAQRLLAMQGEQYARLDKNIKATRAARHDLRHHLSVIKELTAGSENAELDCYIDKYIESLPTDTELVICKNYAVNSIAAHYITLAKSRGIGDFVSN